VGNPQETETDLLSLDLDYGSSETTRKALDITFILSLTKGKGSHISLPMRKDVKKSPQISSNRS